MIETGDLAELLAGHLPKQRWFGGGDPVTAAVEIRAVTELRQGWPGALHVIAEVPAAGGTQGHRYQLFVGLRPPDEIEVFLEGKAEAYMGDVETTQGPAHAYDAVYDPELALDLLHHVAPDISAERARVLLVEQSNTSIVFDERHIMKLFRRLSDGGNPDIEVTTALARVGFEGVVRPEAVWQRDGDDLAVVNEFLAGASEGLSLALTSLRDLYDRRLPPEDCGGDFAPQARRLGIVTAKLHLAMAEAFGTTDPDPRSWADDMLAQLERLGDVSVDTGAVRARYERLAATADAGRALRVHGDLHLGQVMRTDAGWFVLDFEGEPDRPVEERRRPSSPLRDVAGMLRSFHYAAEVALRDRGEEVTDELAALAGAWEERNSFAFSEGYRAVSGIDALLPSDEGCDLVQSAFELDKAVYEVAYEQAHRPDWEAIPRAAVERLLERA
ncbi:MAG: Trehalose synthase [uncultured Acidimicrobiales bacterium]|uniref:Maltokinase n=1 Tax=uncultured Acidimicrobiales bacterium TaxID=310071 RepID=A0A6J4H0S0_9ACTN|nr:MAG: Trehalose synthase [uncultured Acidimicrobiales bacterium]